MFQLSNRDALLAKVVVDIHRHREDKVTATVPLFSLHQVHPIDRGTALAKLNDRVDALRASRDELREARVLDTETLIRHIPSISAIKVVEAADDETYIAFEGNGRLVAMQEVFDEADGIEVEVEIYRFARPDKILRRLRRVQRANRLPLT
ncbi:MAG: hypothetical protein GY716_04695 [bacterium]|nr:hypothetical protein [bacterium]